MYPLADGGPTHVHTLTYIPSHTHILSPSLSLSLSLTLSLPGCAGIYLSKSP